MKAGSIRRSGQSTPRTRLWDRAPIALADRSPRSAATSSSGRMHEFPQGAVVPLSDRLTEERRRPARSTRFTREGEGPRRPQHDVPGFKVALDKLVGRQKMTRAEISTRQMRGCGRSSRLHPARASSGSSSSIATSIGRRAMAQALRSERGPHGDAGDEWQRGRSSSRSWPSRRSHQQPTSIGLTSAWSRRSRHEILPPDLLVLDSI